MRLLVGRGVRYSIAAYLGSLYGRHILRFFARYQKPALSILIGLAVIGGILSLIQYLRYRSISCPCRSKRFEYVAAFVVRRFSRIKQEDRRYKRMRHAN